MKDAAAVIILREGADVSRALGLLEPLGLARVDSGLVAEAMRAVHPDPTVPAVFVATDGADPEPRTDGAVALTQREGDVLGLIASGLSNQEIAQRLFLSPNSVKSYVAGAYRKIGVNSRSRAVLWWLEHRGLPID